MQQVRNGNSTTVSMDNLRYYYYKQDGSIFDPLSTVTPSNATNKLAYVTDAVSSGNYSNDIDNQSSGNYTYDAIGQLISDSQEEIASIEWTVTGKVKQVLRSSGSSKKDLEFVYDPMGHRIAKIVKPQGSTTPSQWKYTYYILDASGNQMATYTKNETDYLYLQDQTIFGSAREGLINRNIAMDTSVLATTVKSNRIGDKQYQMSNHLGNVLSTFSDAVVSDNGGSGSSITAYYPVILSASTYSSFGAPLEDATTNWENVGYRFSFQNQEKDDELKGPGNSVNFEFRMHDPRLGRFFAVDPLTKDYAFNSPYAFCENSIIAYNELEGKEKAPNNKNVDPEICPFQNDIVENPKGSNDYSRPHLRTVNAEGVGTIRVINFQGSGYDYGSQKFAKVSKFSSSTRFDYAGAKYYEHIESKDHLGNNYSGPGIRIYSKNRESSIIIVIPTLDKALNPEDYAKKVELLNQQGNSLIRTVKRQIRLIQRDMKQAERDYKKAEKALENDKENYRDALAKRRKNPKDNPMPDPDKKPKRDQYFTEDLRDRKYATLYDLNTSRPIKK